MATSSDLKGLVVLVLEDNYFQADDLSRALEAAGARVAGPFPDAAGAIESLQRQRPDCAILDINLGAGPSYAAAEAAVALGIPLVLVTGYEASTVPTRFAQETHFKKPVPADAIVDAVVRRCRGPAPPQASSMVKER